MKLIQENSQSFFTLKEFEDLDLPDTKNFKQLSRDGSFSLKNGFINSRVNSINSDEYSTFARLNNYKNNLYLNLKQKIYKLKKKVISLGIIFLLIMIFIILKK